MLRRSFATLILTFSLLIGSLAWSGFLALRTVLDSSRSQEVAESLYDDQAVRDQLADNIASGVGAAIPDDVGVSQDQLDSAARTALDSPAVEALIVDAFVSAHRAFLGEGDPPDSLDAGAFGAASRAALVDAQPSLDAVLPLSPELEVELPTDRIPNVGPIRDFLERVVPIFALAAAAGVAFALISTSDRPAVLRRAGIWAIAVSAVVLLFAYGIPWLGEQFAPDQSEVIATIVGSLAATTRGPAVAMTVAGLAAIVAAFLWKQTPSRVAAQGVTYAPSIAPPSIPADPPKARRGGRAARRDMPVGPSTAHVAAPPPAPSVAPPTAPAGAPPHAPPPPTAVHGAPTPPTAPPLAPPPSAAPSRATPSDVTEGHEPPVDPRWVEGHGWVIDSSSADVPKDATWVPGIGYVVDHPPRR